MAKKLLPQRLRDDGPGKFLVVLEDPKVRDQVREWLEDADYEVLLADDPEDAARLLERRLDIEAVIVDHARAGPVLDLAAEAPEGLAVILAGPADVFAVTRALAEGATSFLPHPITHNDLLVQALRAVTRSRAQRLALDRRLAQPRQLTFEGIVGATPRMKEVLEIIRKAAPTDAPVVVLGESGTGKELVARAIHESSPRARRGKFVAIHLHATPAGLLESELFGHKKGAFTGATADRVGKLELADGGTLFLDELGDIPIETQTKLLRVLETRQFEPVGSNTPIRSDFRLVAATNQDIEALIAEKKFREELWYRLKVVTIHLPPLRERRADIPLLVDRFVREFATRYGKELQGVDREAMAALTRHSWRGNIRELRNVVQQMVVLAEGPTLTVRDLPRELRGHESGETLADPSSASLAGRSMEEIERDAIRETLKLTGGNRKAAAELLQIGERTLYRKIDKYGL
ncbi:MAG: sigma-54-dependent Fis family transcriptional regulator [Planctomycetota bacterium]|nr:MAG: sigma-54-dependent Fis family transcriptional regulator [Planctomycetota bacterium]